MYSDCYTIKFKDVLGRAGKRQADINHYIPMHGIFLQKTYFSTCDLYDLTIDLSSIISLQEMQCPLRLRLKK